MARRTTKPVQLSELLIKVLDEMRADLREMGFEDSYPASSELLALTLKQITRDTLEAAIETRRALFGNNGYRTNLGRKARRAR